MPFIFFFLLLLKGNKQESLKSWPSVFLEACFFLIGAESSLLLMLQDEKEGE